MTRQNTISLKDVYKICPKCGYEWQTQLDLLSDPTLYILGFQAAFTENDEGLILFNHILENGQCNTTFSLKVSDFKNLYDGPSYDDIKYEKDECSGFCKKIENISRCNAKCKNANARDIINKILESYSVKKFEKSS